MRRRVWIVVGLIAAAAAALGVAAAFPGATVSAAGRGTGFGTWAPKSEYGWHGSMLIDGVHTYCILPSEAAPVGPSVDRGVSSDVRGMSAQQRAGINLLVSRYGQTGDAVQAAAVAWAVRSIADWNASMHTYGYPGNDLRGAIHWTFSALSPAHDERIQQLATAYYDEAMRAPRPPTGRSRSRRIPRMRPEAPCGSIPPCRMRQDPSGSSKPSSTTRGPPAATMPDPASTIRSAR